MSEKSATAERSSARSTLSEGVVSPVHRRSSAVLAALSFARAALSITRLGLVAVAAPVAYFVFVVPADLALLLLTFVAAVGVAAMVPLATVGAVVWWTDRT